MAEESSLLQAPERLIGRPCLLASSESVRLDACRDALRRAARAAGYAQTERIDASERQFDWNELARVSVSPGLFAERRLLDLRLELNRELGTTFLVATHDELVLERARRVVHMLDGRVSRDVWD